MTIAEYGQGRSTLLAWLDLRLRDVPGELVLTMRADTGHIKYGLKEAEQLMRYRWRKQGRIRQMITPIQRRAGMRHHPRLVLIIDDIAERSGIISDFFEHLHVASKRWGDVLIVTTSTAIPLPVVPLTFQLVLTADDEARIINKIEKRMNGFGASIKLNEAHIRGVAGGFRNYQMNTRLFVSIVMNEVRKEASTDQIEARIEKAAEDLAATVQKKPAAAQRKMLLLIAACQAVGCPLPLSIVPEPNDVEKLCKQARVLITIRGRQVFLPGPSLAMLVLEKLNIHSEDQLAGLLAEGLSHFVNRNGSDWSAMQGGFLRHLLHRYAKGRHFEYVGIDGRSVSSTLFKESRNAIVAHLNDITNIGLLCAWATTLRSVDCMPFLSTLCTRVIDRQTISLIETQTFGDLAKALSHLAKQDEYRSLCDRSLRVLCLADLAEFAPIVPNRELHINIAIAGYCQLMSALGYATKALASIEGIEHLVTLDAISLREKGMLHQKANQIESAAQSYELAVQLSTDDNRRSPGIEVDCRISWLEFRVDYHWPFSDILPEVQMIFDYLVTWRLGWPAQKRISRVRSLVHCMCVSPKFRFSGATNIFTNDIPKAVGVEEFGQVPMNLQRHIVKSLRGAVNRAKKEIPGDDAAALKTIAMACYGIYCRRADDKEEWLFYETTLKPWNVGNGVGHWNEPLRVRT